MEDGIFVQDSLHITAMHPQNILLQIENIKEKCRTIKPKLVVWSLVYNHAPYLEEYFKGVLMQKTDFPFVVIVHDDASTDESAEIIAKYIKEYPDLFIPIYEETNQYSNPDSHLTSIMEEAIKATGAPYCAFCEGDDFWTVPEKLQTQVNYLDTHVKCVYTSHRFDLKIKNEKKSVLQKNSYLDKYRGPGFAFNKEYLLDGDWVTKTLTAVFRSRCLFNNPLKKAKYFRDNHMNIHFLSQGYGYCFAFNGGTYRIQDTGIWSQLSRKQQMECALYQWREICKIEPSRFNKKYYSQLIWYNFRFHLSNKSLPTISMREYMKLPFIAIKHLIRKLEINSITNMERIHIYNETHRDSIQP